MMSSSQIINQGERHKVGEKSRSSTASEREKTKLRERHRRSITTKIFNGLRKHGSYNLPPRADINDVLRALAAEARWVVEADGTTYRAQDEVTGNQAKSQILQGLPVSSSLTPMCSLAGVGEDNGGGFNHVPPGTINIRDVKGGECSTTVSPRQMGIQASNNSLIFPNTAISSPFTSPATSEVGGQVGGSPFMPTFHGKDDVGAAYLSAESTVETTEQIIRRRNDTVSNNSSMFFDPYGMSVAMSSIMMQMPQNHQALPQECCALNQNTPIASPQRIVHDELEDLSVDEECCFAFIDT